MPPKYKPISQLSANQRQRILKLLSPILILRVLLPCFGIWTLSVIVMLLWTAHYYPNIDRENGWYVALVLLFSFCIMSIAAVLLFASMIRSLIHYRQKRRGRIKALRLVLVPSDQDCSFRRRFMLYLYGVDFADRVMLDLVWDLDNE